ncbi:hypothetical protein GTO89_07875 [Heliobacterium gestii]|uniref:YcdB/YcdC repeated domain-containing protein n=1 Tax=Heliomicrobium gestii TaxID=2699 RepID=A0A845LDE2_HELGE|nr:YcdB/YcdC domain-containing protein [Heliomicrobium gestii]MBM7866254.1 hypothetical protein [Heliomicrobium gestii]MZP42950.1 hypothetical protein [Heliomicrobium gestii]
MIDRERSRVRKGRHHAVTVTLAGLVITGMLAGAFPVAAALAEEPRQGIETAPPLTATITEKAPPEVEARIEQVTGVIRSLYPEFAYLQRKETVRRNGIRRPDGIETEQEEWRLFFDDQPREAPKKEEGAYNQALMVFDTSGNLLSFRWQNPDWAGTALPDSDLAKKKATAFLDRLLGDGAKVYRAGRAGQTETRAAVNEAGKKLAWVRRTVHFDRAINGIPCVDCGGEEWEVAVDGSGRIVGLKRRNGATPDEALFPDPAKAISPVAAKGAFSERLQMVLTYQPQEYLNREPGVVFQHLLPGRQPVLLTYQTGGAIGPIDALTGKPLWESGAEVSKPEKLLRLSGQGKSIEAKDPQAAERVIETVFGIDMSGMAFVDPLFRKRETPAAPFAKMFQWVDKKPGGTRFITMETESDTGRVCGYSLEAVRTGEQQPAQENKKGVAIPVEEAKKKALRVLQQFLPARAVEMNLLEPSAEPTKYPDWVDRSKLPKDSLDSPNHEFYFIPVHQGVPIESIQWSVFIDKRTGNVSGFNYQAVDFDQLPVKSGLISPEQAKAASLAKVDLRLVYIWPDYLDQKAPRPVLVYKPEYRQRGVIDARSGKFIPYDRDE